MSETVGQLLRQWRGRRGLSQLALASRADVSTRHVSYVETGRTRPSRSMVLQLAEHLGVPLRERNVLLVAAGYAPFYRERPLDAPDLAAVGDAIGRILDGHRPYPALVVDGRWDLVRANTAAELFFVDVDPVVLRPPVNMMRVGLHPDGLGRRVLNYDEVRARLLGLLARQVGQTGDRYLAALLDEVRSYGPPIEPGEPRAEDIALPLRLRHRGEELNFVTMTARFGSAFDITLDELVIESYLPADPATAGALERLQGFGAEFSNSARSALTWR